jgi:DNA primase
MRSADGRMDAFRFLQPAIEKITDPLERAAIANDVAGYLGVEPGLVLERFRKSASERRAPAPRAESHPQIPAVERILLNALISSDEARVEILPRLADVLTAEFTTREIFATLRNLVDAGPQSLSSAALFSAVESRLVGPSQTLLHEIVAADEMGDGSFSLEQARACLRRLELDFKKRQMDELRTSVKTAEREGRVQEAFGFMAELSRLERELRGAGGG